MPLICCSPGPPNDTSDPHPNARQTPMISVGEFCCVLNESLSRIASTWRTRWRRRDLFLAQHPLGFRRGNFFRVLDRVLGGAVLGGGFLGDTILVLGGAVVANDQTNRKKQTGRQQTGDRRSMDGRHCNSPCVHSRSHAPRGNALFATLCVAPFRRGASEKAGSHAERGNQNDFFITLVPTLRVGTHCLQRSALPHSDAERRKKPVPTRSVETRMTFL